MITGFFLDILYAFISFLLGLLPLGSSIPASWATGIATVIADIRAFSFIVPLDVLFTCLSIAVVFHLFVFVWNLVHWVLSLIRGHKH